MDVVGSDYVYLSDECSQDVLSLWSDTWSVGDPVNMPEMMYDDDFSDVFLAEQAQFGECVDDSGDLLSQSHALESVCPNVVAGYVPPQIVTSLDEHLPCANNGDSVLSPTDSGHESIASGVTATQATFGDIGAHDDFVDLIDEHTSELSNQQENKSDIHQIAVLTSESTDVDCNSRVAEMEFLSQRPRRVAARRAEIALVREESDFDDDEDDDDVIENGRFQGEFQLQTAESSASRRGRRRAAEVNRNALNARMNRQKKKAYMASLEAHKTHLLDENKRMKSMLSKLVYERDDLIDEVKYLKSVLANDSAIAKLVQGIDGPPLKLSSRFDYAGQKRKDVESDHNYGPPDKLRATSSNVKAGGICLHVSENQLSMELCHRCALMAGGGHNL